MTLMNEIRDNSNLRKIFGKRELKIIEKQLLGINLSQSEKNRLSRDIRKKFKMISKLSKFEEDFDLKKGSEIDKIIGQARNIILDSAYFTKIIEIGIFGSTVQNKRTFRSDIDIYVKFEEIDSKEATKFRIDISGRLGEKIDIQVYNILPYKIKTEIDKYKRIIYKKHGK